MLPLELFSLISDFTVKSEIKYLNKQLYNYIDKSEKSSYWHNNYLNIMKRNNMSKYVLDIFEIEYNWKHECIRLNSGGLQELYYYSDNYKDIFCVDFHRFTPKEIYKFIENHTIIKIRGNKIIREFKYVGRDSIIINSTLFNKYLEIFFNMDKLKNVHISFIGNGEHYIFKKILKKKNINIHIKGHGIKIMTYDDYVGFLVDGHTFKINMDQIDDIFAHDKIYYDNFYHSLNWKLNTWFPTLLISSMISTMLLLNYIKK